MASRPKRRRSNPPTEPTSGAPSVSTNQQVEDLVHSLVTNLLPTVEATCRQIILAHDHLQNTSTPPANATSTSVSSSYIIQPPTQPSGNYGFRYYFFCHSGSTQPKRPCAPTIFFSSANLGGRRQDTGQNPCRGICEIFLSPARKTMHS